MRDEMLDRLLDGSRPPVTPPSPQLDEALTLLQRSVVRPPRRPGRRRARVIIGGLSLAGAVGISAVATASVLPFWSGEADVKRFSTSEGTRCEAVITVSNGPAPAGGPSQIARKQRDARAAATDVVRSFEFVPDEISEELERADYLPVEKVATPELSAFVQLAQRAVDSELERRGLPPVALALESSCQASRR